MTMVLERLGWLGPDRLSASVDVDGSSLQFEIAFADSDLGVRSINLDGLLPADYFRLVNRDEYRALLKTVLRFAETSEDFTLPVRIESDLP